MKRFVLGMAFMVTAVFANAEKFDVRDYVETAVPQSQVGNTCWAYSTMHTLMNTWAYMSNQNDASYVEYPADSILSARHLVENRGYSVSEAQGGNSDFAVSYLAAGLGPMTTGGDSAGYFAPCGEYLSFTAADETSIAGLKEVLKKYGSVSAKVNSVNVTSPVYYDSENYSSYVPGSSGVSTVDHGVTIVGFDDDFNSFGNLATKPEKPGAWIVENSYGTGVHNNGYYYMSYYSVPLTDVVMYPTRVRRDEVDTVMQKDRYVASRKATMSSSSMLLLAFYTAGSDLKVKGVGVYVADEGTEVQTALFRGTSPSAMASSESLVSKDTTIEHRGFHYIPISAEYAKGDGVCVMMTYKVADGGKVTLTVEGDTSDGLVTGVAYNGGQYILWNGEWLELSAVVPNVNLTAKVYAERAGTVTGADEAGGGMPALRSGRGYNLWGQEVGDGYEGVVIKDGVKMLKRGN